MNVINGTHKIRIYRQAQGRKHDLNLVRNLIDVSGADVWGQVKPMTSEIIELTPGTMPARRIELWMSSDEDLDIGYLVDVKRTRVLNGVREVVEEALTANVVAGGVTLSVVKTTGFRRGDAVLVWDNSTSWEEARVQTVGTTSLTLYADTAVRAGYSSGAVVRASRMYRVEDQRIPEDVGPYRVAVLMHTAHHLAVD